MVQRAIIAVQKESVEQNLLRRDIVPRSTLQCYLKKEDVTTNLWVIVLFQVSGVATELELVHSIKLMESTLFGLTRKNVTEIAFTLALDNKIKYSFGNGYAGCGWLDLFMYRHSELSIRQPIGISKTRTVGTVYEEMCKGWHMWPVVISELKCLITIAISTRVTFNI